MDSALFAQTACTTWRNYAGLTKPRVVVLLLLTTFVAMWLATGGRPDWPVAWWTMLGGYLSAGGAGAINCYLDRDLDARMARTCQRAIPAGKLTPQQALRFGIMLALMSFLVLWFGANGPAALLSLAGLLFYTLVYTWWLKRRTVHNIVIGGVAGAMPPLVGWVAATGQLEPMAWILAGIVLAWTPSHFWALALLRRNEYALAGVPMLPVVKGEQATRKSIFAWTALTVALSFLPLINPVRNQADAVAGNVAYTVAAALLGAVFVTWAWFVLKRGGQALVRKFYLFTIVYLALLFLCMTFTLS